MLEFIAVGALASKVYFVISVLLFVIILLMLKYRKEYEDLKKAHTETVVPVTLEDYNKVKKFNNVTDYTDYRNNQNIVPLSELQAREYLSNKEKMQEKESTERAYKLAKQLEDSQKKSQKYWASMQHIN
jgi:hypothetical protein